MNTNSKILPNQDSNLFCHSPSTLTFPAPAFYLSSFTILVGGRFSFSQEHRYFLCDGGQRHDRRISLSPPPHPPPPPPPGKLSATNCPWKLAPIKIAPGEGWGQAIHQGQFFEEQFSQFQPKGSCTSGLNFLPLKTELLHRGIHTYLKGLVGFNLFLFYSQRKKIA